MSQQKRPWEAEEDVLLKELVLQYTSNRDSKADAFRMAAKKLKRSEAACQTRWNAKLKEADQLNLEHVIQFLKTMPPIFLLEENNKLKAEQEGLKAEHHALAKKWENAALHMKEELALHEGVLKVINETK